jgi:hypothetical protein
MHDRRNAGDKKNKSGNIGIFSWIKRRGCAYIQWHWDSGCMQTICRVLSRWTDWLTSLFTLSWYITQYNYSFALDLSLKLSQCPILASMFYARDVA